MIHGFDISDFEIEADPSPSPSATRSPARRRQKAPFLRGPVPMAWLRAAYRLHGQALPVAIELWHEAGCKNSMMVALSLSRMKQYGVDRWAAGRGLAQLEDAGLVSVERHAGRKPIVTLLPLGTVNNTDEHH